MYQTKDFISERPKGAIVDLAEIQSILQKINKGEIEDQPIYEVVQGKSAFAGILSKNSTILFVQVSTELSPFLRMTLKEYPFVSLRDRNILEVEGFNGYNTHFFFLNKEDAENFAIEMQNNESYQQYLTDWDEHCRSVFKYIDQEY